MVKNVNRINVIICIVSAHNTNLLDKFCEDLHQTFGNSVYQRQYFSKMMPLRSNIKRHLKNNPNIELIIYGNTNSKFGTREEFDALFDRSDNPFLNAGVIDMRPAEETGTGKDLRDAISELLKETKEHIEKDLIELIERN